MKRKKPSISFHDLGLSTPLPNALAKSREQRRQEQIQEKKSKKQRVKAAMDEVAASRGVVEKHKAHVQSELDAEKAEKAQWKKQLNIERVQLRNERSEQEKLKEKERMEHLREMVAQSITVQRESEVHAKEIQQLIQKQQKELIKATPQSVHIPIHRTEKILSERLGLPVLREEQPIVEAINNTNRTCVLVCGETGSGKTTQIPQFLWEAGYGHPEGAPFGREGRILITEPRRVAAVSMAKRVAEELNVNFGCEVCYHVRYDNNLSDDYTMKFATEGIVLKEIQSDFLLKQYSAIIVDEAHERSISCDILIGLLSRIAPLRNDLFQEELRANGGDVTQTKVKPLKLVIMSATMRVTDFKDNSTLFPVVPPLINVEARRFPVSNHFAKKTELREYVDQAFEKVRQIHRKLPPGGILVFLCTQQEIEDLCDRLRKYYAKTKIEYYENAYSKQSLVTKQDIERGADTSNSDTGVESEGERDEFGLKTMDYALDDDDDKDGNGKESSTVAAEKRGRSKDEVSVAPSENEINGDLDTLHVLPLYALLDFEKQQQVFVPPPPGKRLCVVATNVAETSITIPNIKYVVDAGRVKSKIIDEETKASSFRIEWASQASSEQRSGRAGRVGPGHCYRLYSTAVFSNLMNKHSIPEILRTPLDSVVLLMKHIGIEHVGSFPFPSAPRDEDLKTALQHLSVIGALNRDDGFRITPLGREMVYFPVPPRFARAILEAKYKKLSPFLMEAVLAIVSVCSTSSNVFTGEGNQIKASKKDDIADQRREGIRSLVNNGSDLLTFFNAFRAYSHDMRSSCRTYCLVQKSMYEARQLYRQLHGAVTVTQKANTDDLVDTLDANETFSLGKTPEGSLAGSPEKLNRESEIQLRQVFIPGLLDQVARRATVHECRSLGVEYNDKKTSRTPYMIPATRSVAFIHPTSTVSRTFPAPEYVTFSFLQKVYRSETKEAQTTMLGVTIVTKEWLHVCDFTE